ncbi:MAG: sulfite exporter TauE/SafE family protein [Bacteroidia bacterium]
MREAKNLLFAGIVNPYTKWALIGVAALLITIIFIVISIQFAPDFSESETIKQLVTDFNLTDFLMFALVGFLAQIVDGALGMAYGISSTTFLLSLGLPPASASASVHAAEVVTSGASGLSHLKFKNVNKKLFRSLVIPGVIGAVIGAYFLSSIDGKEIKPYIAAYLMIMGLVVIYKALQKNILKTKTKNIGPLALFGGLVDAIGGGGWGPVVVSNLLSKGRNPRYTIGSVNLAEFFIALAGASTFTFMLGIDNWIVVVGLMAGGVFASPFAAYLCQKVNNRTLMLIVGFVIIFLSLRTIMLSIN